VANDLFPFEMISVADMVNQIKHFQGQSLSNVMEHESKHYPIPIIVKRNGTRVKALPDSVSAVAMSSCIICPFLMINSYLMNKNDSRLAVSLEQHK